MNGLKAALAMLMLGAVMPLVLLGLACRWVDKACVSAFERVYTFACETLLMGKIDEDGKCDGDDDAA